MPEVEPRPEGAENLPSPSETENSPVPESIEPVESREEKEDIADAESKFQREIQYFLQGESFQRGSEYYHPQLGEVSQSIAMSLNAAKDLLKESTQIKTPELQEKAIHAVVEQLSEMQVYIRYLIREVLKSAPELRDEWLDLPMFHDFYTHGYRYDKERNVWVGTKQSKS